MAVNLQAIADEAPLGRFQLRVVVLCSLVMMIDGYDLAIIGVSLPSIIEEMQMDPSVAGLIASCALVGMMLGAMLLGGLANRIGRVRCVALCVFVFSFFTAAAGFASGAVSLALLRFIAGLGLGGVLPSITSALAEYAPRRYRSLLTMVMFAAYPVGGIIAALLGRQFLETFGWQIVFYVAGLPLLLVPVLLRWLPESGAVLQARGDQQALQQLARQIDPARSLPLEAAIQSQARASHGKVPVARLFQEGRGFSTAMLWLAFFSGFFMLYALHSWLTKLMAMAGHSLGSALTFLMLLNVGSVVGSLIGGWLCDRYGLKRVLALMLVCGAVATALLAQPLAAPLLMLVVFVVGLTAASGQGVCYAYVSQFYPNDIRPVGVGMASGMGRMGGIAAPVIIGVLISLQLPFAQNFYVIALFAVLQAVAVLLIDNRVADFNAARTA